MFEGSLGVLLSRLWVILEHLNMPLSETLSSPTLAYSTPLLRESARNSSLHETLFEALPPSHLRLTSRLPNSYCDWAPQFFLRNNYPRAISCQGQQSGSIISTISHLETDSRRSSNIPSLLYSSRSRLIVALSDSNSDP